MSDISVKTVEEPEESRNTLKQRIYILEAQLKNLNDNTVITSMRDMALGYKEMEGKMRKMNKETLEYKIKLIGIYNITKLIIDTGEELVESFMDDDLNEMISMAKTIDKLIIIDELI